MDRIMNVVALVGMVGAVIFLLLLIWPRPRSEVREKPLPPLGQKALDSFKVKEPEKFLPPLHGGYKPRIDPTKDYSKHPPKPPAGKGGGSS